MTGLGPAATSVISTAASSNVSACASWEIDAEWRNGAASQYYAKAYPTIGLLTT